MAKLLNIVTLSSKFVKPSFSSSPSLYKTSLQFQNALTRKNIRSFASLDSKFSKLVEQAKNDLVKDKDGNYKSKSGKSSIDQFSPEKVDYSEDQMTSDLLDEVRNGTITSKEIEQMYKTNYQDEDLIKEAAAKQMVLMDEGNNLREETSAVSAKGGEEYTYDYDYDYDNNDEGLSELELSESEDEAVIAKQKRDAEGLLAENESKYLSFMNAEVTKLVGFHRERNILKAAIEKAKQIEKSGQVKPVKEVEQVEQQEEVDPEMKQYQVSGIESVNVDQYINRFKDINANFNSIDKEIDLSQSKDQQIARLDALIPKLKGTNEEKAALKKSITEELTQYHKNKEASRKSFQTKAAEIKNNAFFKNSQFESYN